MALDLGVLQSGTGLDVGPFQSTNTSFSIELFLLQDWSGGFATGDMFGGFHG